MSGYSKKIQHWLKFKPVILVESMILEPSMLDGMKKIALQACIGEIIGDSIGDGDQFIKSYGESLASYCLLLEKTTQEGYCAFDFAQEIGEILQEGIDVEEILLLSPEDYLYRMDWDTF